MGREAGDVAEAVAASGSRLNPRLRGIDIGNGLQPKTQSTTPESVLRIITPSRAKASHASEQTGHRLVRLLDRSATG